MNEAVPSAFWALIRPHTGDVTDVRHTSAGHSSDVTAVVECERGPFFVKAIRNRPGGRRDSLIRERLVNPSVRAVSPALRWNAEDEQWLALGFNVVEGRPSDFTWGSADLPAVVGVLERIGRLSPPDVVREWLETRWDPFARDAEEAALFQGDALLYTDINPGNLLIGERETWAVDWSWPTRGAGFIDPACLVVQLVAAGHDAASAESWAAWCAAWRHAERRAVDAFAAATVRMYRDFAARRPDAEWLAVMAAAGQEWADHRGVTGV
ncbi:hypothetical protein DVA86_25460 [Streptomyces armeniacus]|uniref:Protein kinase n=1 Tax=Streptomyces armeniacus TaxID=83291 RepID=A0A345XV35_9ACTN|nr:hypothetical protein [Streptomyces armeniacus]AXK35501.1 hypothetical protein DVA86_25460 [Streptomyces armeniacus]